MNYKEAQEMAEEKIKEEIKNEKEVKILKRKQLIKNMGKEEKEEVIIKLGRPISFTKIGN